MVGLHVPGREEVLAQLQRILASQDFDAAPRNRRFLEYIVEHSLKGEAGRIKAYTIATEVFGRAVNFDPQLDPIVRIEASRLRRSLERYYLTSGRSDAVRIEMPKGSYAATFAAASEPAPEPLSHSERRVGNGTRDQSDAQTGPTILVMPFSDESPERQHPGLARAFTREIILGLTRFRDLNVYSERVSILYSEQPELRAQVQSRGVAFTVTGGVSVFSDRIRVVAALVDTDSGKYLWSDGFEDRLSPEQMFSIQKDISDRVVQMLAQRYGVIFTETVREIRDRPPQELSSYECVLAFYHYYWRLQTAESFASVRQCLERTVRREPHYAEALSSLSLMYVDAYRLSIDRGAIDIAPLPRALALAQRAVDLAPQAAHGHRALYLTYWFMNDVAKSLESGERALALNPNDTDVVADVGNRLCFAGQWERGLPLIEAAYKRNPALPDHYRFAHFVYHYIDGRYEASLHEAKRIKLPDVIYTHIALAISYARLGRSVEATAAVNRILALDPGYADRAWDDLRRRNYAPEVLHALIDGLREAGLKVEALG